MHILLDVNWFIFFLCWAVITMLHFKVFNRFFTLHCTRICLVSNLKLRYPYGFLLCIINLFLLERIDSILNIIMHCLMVYWICTTTLWLQRQENNKGCIIFKRLNDVYLSKLWRLSFEYLCVSNSYEFELFTVLADDGTVHGFESCVNRSFGDQ